MKLPIYVASFLKGAIFLYIELFYNL